MRTRRPRITRIRAAALVLPSLLLLPQRSGGQSRLRLEMEEPRTVYGSGNGTGQLLAFSDGSLLLAGLDFSLRSTDQGRSWYTQPGIRGMIALLGSGGAYVMNGATDFYVSEGRTRPGGSPGVFLGGRMLLRDQQELLAPRKPEWDETTFRIEQVAPFTDDTGKLLGAPFISGPIGELANGDLLALTYGKFAGDTVPIPGLTPTKGERWFKSRT